MTIAGKLAQISKLMESGLISQQQAMKLMGYVDLFWLVDKQLMYLGAHKTIVVLELE